MFIEVFRLTDWQRRKIRKHNWYNSSELEVLIRHDKLIVYGKVYRKDVVEHLHLYMHSLNVYKEPSTNTHVFLL